MILFILKSIFETIMGWQSIQYIPLGYIFHSYAMGIGINLYIQKTDFHIFCCGLPKFYIHSFMHYMYRVYMEYTNYIHYIQYIV